MGIEISSGQRKRVEKINRLREYFKGEERREIHEWSIEDEKLDFKLMPDFEIAEYLARRG